MAWMYPTCKIQSVFSIPWLTRTRLLSPFSLAPLLIPIPLSHHPMAQTQSSQFSSSSNLGFHSFYSHYSLVSEFIPLFTDLIELHKNGKTEQEHSHPLVHSSNAVITRHWPGPKPEAKNSIQVSHRGVAGTQEAITCCLPR